MSLEMLAAILSLIGAVFAIWQFKRSRNDFLAQRKALEEVDTMRLYQQAARLYDLSRATWAKPVETDPTPFKIVDPKSNVIFVGDPSHLDSDHQVDFKKLVRLMKAYSLTERQRLQTTQRCEKVFQVWSAVLPARINNEVLGDYLEDIHRRIAAGESRSLVFLRLVWAVFWTGVDAIGYFVKAIGRSKSTN